MMSRSPAETHLNRHPAPQTRHVTMEFVPEAACEHADLTAVPSEKGEEALYDSCTTNTIEGRTTERTGADVPDGPFPPTPDNT